MMTFDIEPGPLDQALKSYAERLHGQMLYDARLVAGRQTPGVKGQYTAKAALQGGGSRFVTQTALDRTDRERSGIHF